MADLAFTERRLNVEQAFHLTGSLGRFQALSFMLLFIPPLFHIARMTSVDFAVEYQPKHRCAVPNITDDTYDKGDYHHQVLVNETIPLEDECHTYNTNRTYQYDKYHRPIDANSSDDFQSCPNGWVYDQTVIRNSDSAKFNLVCDHSDLREYVDMCVMIGSLIGAVIFGAISDGFGRKIGFICAVPVCVGAGLGISWAPNYITLVVLFALSGAGCTGMFNCVFVLALESVLPEHRNVPGLLIQIFLPLGQIIMAGIGYGLRDWIWINVIISAPVILFLSYYWLLTESPLWLNSKGKLDKLMKLFMKIARTNGCVGSLNELEMEEQLEGLIEINTVNELQPAARDSIKDMFTSCVLCIRTIITFINWFAANYDYYGLILFSAHLGGGLYLNFFLGALVEIPAHVISFLLVNRLGRKPVHCTYYLLVIVTMAIATGMKVGQVGPQSAVLAVTLIGKFGAAGLIGTSFLWMVELYPVSVRSTGAGLMAIAAKLGAILVPFIIGRGHDMKTPFGDAVPYIGFCAISVVAFLACLTLPETSKRTLPTTVAEARKFGRAPRLLQELDDYHRSGYETFQRR